VGLSQMAGNTEYKAPLTLHVNEKEPPLIPPSTGEKKKWEGFLLLPPR